MRFQITDSNCSYCKNALTNWDYRFQGKHYCRNCYERLFELTRCEKCDKQKKIFIFLTKRICKKCLVIDKPCIRCGKEEYTHGLISEYGPVCASCSPYFKEYKKCVSCQKESYDITNRTLLDGSKKTLCTNCFNKTLPLCHRCHRHKKPYETVNGKSICKTCATQKDRICKQCHSPFPSGRGRICRECSYENTLERKTKQYSALLSEHTSYLFQGFSTWLKNRRGILYTSLKVQKYFKFFSELDEIAQDLERFPIYEEIVRFISVKETRKHLLVVIYLQDINKIVIDKTIQKEYANLDMIDRLLNYFEKEDQRFKLIFEYYSMLKDKAIKKKMSLRSIRLALTPAAKFLKYCSHFENNKISNNALNGYLWVYRGQKSAIYGFINFLNEQHDFSLVGHKKLIPISRPRYTKAQLKSKLIEMLKMSKIPRKHPKILLQIALGYLHGIDLPNNAFIDTNDFKRDKSGNYYIRLAGMKFIFPIEIIRFIKDSI